MAFREVQICFDSKMPMNPIFTGLFFSTNQFKNRNTLFSAIIKEKKKSLRKQIRTNYKSPSLGVFI